MVTSIFVNLSQTLIVYRTVNGISTNETLSLENLSGDAIEVFEDGLAWLSSLLDGEEEFTQTLIEPIASRPDGEGFRSVYSFAVSVRGPLGERTFVTTTEAMPEELRDAVLGTIQVVDTAPN